MTTATKPKPETWTAERIATAMEEITAATVVYNQELRDLRDRGALIERFRSEVQAHCPHAVRYVDHDVVDGRSYFVCEACQMVLEPTERRGGILDYDTPIFAQK